MINDTAVLVPPRSLGHHGSWDATCTRPTQGGTPGQAVWCSCEGVVWMYGVLGSWYSGRVVLCFHSVLVVWFICMVVASYGDVVVLWRVGWVVVVCCVNTVVK